MGLPHFFGCFQRQPRCDPSLDWLTRAQLWEWFYEYPINELAATILGRCASQLLGKSSLLASQLTVTLSGRAHDGIQINFSSDGPERLQRPYAPRVWLGGCEKNRWSGHRYLQDLPRKQLCTSCSTGKSSHAGDESHQGALDVYKQTLTS